MLKGIIKRQFSLLLSVLISVCMLVPAWTAGVSEVYAASLAIDVNGLTATYDDGEWTAFGNSISGSATGTAKGSCSDATSKTVKLTLKNSKGSDARLTFNYSKPVKASGGYVKINSEEVTTSGAFSADLAENASIIIEVYSGNPGANTTSITLSDIQFVKQANVTTTFKPASTGGSFSVDGRTITENFSTTQLSTQAYSLKAIPDPGYKFFAWQSSSAGLISYNSSYAAMFETDQTITAIFLKSTDPVFQVGTAWFTDLNEANSYAVSNRINNIILISDGVLDMGTYTISSGKTLLIPFNDAHTSFADEPEVIFGSHTTPTAYRTLTMAAGASIIVDEGGVVSVPSKLSASGQNASSWNGTPTGPHGRIHMQDGSSVILNNGAKLYCSGYISGGGEVVANSGSTVWECFQIRSWRGGSATSGMHGNSNQVFPINQYYVQNIEAPLTIKKGAAENVYTAVNMSGKAYPTSAVFIGSNGLFRISSGNLQKRYDSSSDRLIIDVNGDLSFSNIRISLAGISVDSSDYVLPITSNITVNLQSGTAELTQNTAFLPGAKVNISNGANLSITSGKNTYVYDASGWDAFAASGLKLVPVGYSTVNGTKAVRNSDSLTDATFDINGTVTANGALFTTSGGANLTSSMKTGKVIFSKAPVQSGTTYQATQSGTDISYTSIAITSPQLHNGIADPEFTQTSDASAGDYYSYCAIHDRWEKGDPHEATYEFVQFDWSSDYSSATAIFKCEQTDEIVNVPVTVKRQETPATCEESGKIVYTAEAALGEASGIESKTVVTNPLGHAYDEPVYEWAEDNSTVTATRTCTNDPAHVETETVDTTSEVTTPAKCDEKGKTTYTATFENKAFEKQTKTVENIDAAGHDWDEGSVTTDPTCTEPGVKTYTCRNDSAHTRTEEIKPIGHAWGEPKYEWAEDNSTATATRTCTNDPAHVETETVDTTSEVTTPAKCDEKGKTTYTATFENKAFEKQTKTEENIDAIGHDWDEGSVTTDPTCTEPGVRTYTCKRDSSHTRTEEIKPEGHAWGEPAYEWAEDNSKVTATCVCIHDKEHILEEEVRTVKDETLPDCENDGEERYKAQFSDPQFSAQSKTVKIEALGHLWNEPVYVWSEDKSTVTATVNCSRDNSHIITENAKTSYKVTLEPGAETEGLGQYIASFKNDLFTDQMFDVPIPATGHTYSLDSWRWADNYLEATLVMSREDGQKVEVPATVSVSKEDASCTQSGSVTYTATTMFNDMEYTDSKSELVPAQGHDYQLSNWVWSGNKSEASAVVICSKCSNVKEIKAEITSETLSPTCEADGQIIYTASAKSGNDIYTDKKKEIIAAVGHKWSTPEYEWTDIDTNVTATAVCENDKNHVLRETVPVSEEITKAASCETVGIKRLSANFSNKTFARQTKDIEIAALGHKWDSGKITKEASATENGIVTYTCHNCKAEKQRVLSKLSDAVGDGDPSDSVFSVLKFRSPKQTRKSIKLSWSTVANADTYVLYGNRCGTKYRMEKLASFKGGQNRYTLKKVLGSKVKKGTYYKLMLVAFDRNGNKISTSKVLHVATKGGKVTNFKSLKTKAKRNKVKLKVGKSFKLRTKGIKAQKKLKVRTHRKIQYEISDSSIITVNSKGVIKAKKKGTSYIYAYAQNGVYRRIKVVVR